MKVKDVTKILNEWAPEDSASEWDNVGLLIGSDEEELTGILVALDATERVVEEAISTDSNLIISHHPIIFEPLKALRKEEHPASVIYQLIKNDISLYTMHTNLDAAAGGVNEELASKLGLVDIEPLNSDAEGRYGRIGKIDTELSLSQFLEKIKSVLNVEALTYRGNLDSSVKIVAISSGSGGAFLETAIEKNADVFVSADFKHSHWLQGGDRIALINAGHFESERVVKQPIKDYLENRIDFGKIQVRISESESIPFVLFNGNANT